MWQEVKNYTELVFKKVIVSEINELNSLINESG